MRLPAAVQPFLTWLTAKPAPGEPASPRKPITYVAEAIGLVIGGCAVSALTLTMLSAAQPLFWLLLFAGLLATSSGLGLFQVVIFHHCSHGTVFSTRERNRLVGRLVSAVLLFKHFDVYQKEHMLHHNANKLFTDEDEFTDFVVGICDLRTALDRRALWRQLLTLLVSPVFHGRFLWKRIKGSLASHERSHNLIGIGVWAALLIGAALTHMLIVVLVAWVLPVTVLLQIATVFRILCEHRLPSVDIIALRGKQLVCEATAGVFPGLFPPRHNARSFRGLAAWSGWWANMLTVQLFVRLFVLVGDAPCHDFHHRRPGKRWTNYVHARQMDIEAGCPGFPLNYIETWGLFRAVDENFAAMARAPADLLG
ncbi:fatty acid desaturase family protein [Acidiphilium sp.]|uniref:fatty acid desaturase family protein n=1 Tax=Acidiphilium sp. TaxID=527 RepID=UPI003D092C9B